MTRRQRRALHRARLHVARARVLIRRSGHAGQLLEPLARVSRGIANTIDEVR